MIDNRHLPLWLHRVCNGLFPAALLAGFSSFWFGAPTGTWSHFVSLCLLWSSIPVGLFFAAATHRFSVVEGLAGDVGYEEPKTEDGKAPAKLD
jgi:hypothetical protein